MSIALQYCHVTVNDVDESLGFYRDALGLEVRNDVASGGFRWVTLGSPDQPGLEIVLSEPHAGRSQADGDALQELLTKGVLPMLVFRAGDLEAVFEKVRASGAEVLEEPTDQPWGARLCVPRSLGQPGADFAGIDGVGVVRRMAASGYLNGPAAAGRSVGARLWPGCGALRGGHDPRLAHPVKRRLCANIHKGVP